MKITGWKAFYTQRRVFSSEEIDWSELPKQGVLSVVVYYDNGYRDILSGNRRYFRAIGSSGNEFIKQSLWKEKNLKDVYRGKPEDIKEGIWDDDESYKWAVDSAMAAK